MQIAMIGLGRMGAGISRRLIAKGHSVAGLACDLMGAICIWAGFKTYRGE